MKVFVRKLLKVNERAKWRETSFSRELTQDKLKAILANNDPKTLFVHFDNGVTDKNIPQTTFNPATGYKTPIGIYTYPMSYVKNKLMPKISKTGIDTGTEVDFAGDYKYIYIYKAKNPSDIYTIKRAVKEGMFEKAIFEAYKMLNDDKKFISILSKAVLDGDEATGITDDEADEFGYTDYGDEEEYEDEYDQDDEANKSENANSIPVIAKKIVEQMKIKNAPLPTGTALKLLQLNLRSAMFSWFYFIYQVNELKNVKVTSFLQNKLGIKILVDEGEGIIHPNEPTQAIIFNPAFAELVTVDLNPYRSSRGKALGYDEKSIDPKSVFEKWPPSGVKNYLSKLKTLNKEILNRMKNSAMYTNQRERRKELYPVFLERISQEKNEKNFISGITMLMNNFYLADVYERNKASDVKKEAERLKQIYEILKARGGDEYVKLFMPTFDYRFEYVKGLAKSDLADQLKKDAKRLKYKLQFPKWASMKENKKVIVKIVS